MLFTQPAAGDRGTDSRLSTSSGHISYYVATSVWFRSFLMRTQKLFYTNFKVVYSGLDRFPLLSEP